MAGIEFSGGCANPRVTRNAHTGGCWTSVEIFLFSAVKENLYSYSAEHTFQWDILLLYCQDYLHRVLSEPLAEYCYLICA